MKPKLRRPTKAEVRQVRIAVLVLPPRSPGAADCTEPDDEEWVKEYFAWRQAQCFPWPARAVVHVTKAIHAANAVDDAEEARLRAEGWDLPPHLDGYHMIRQGRRWVPCDTIRPGEHPADV